MDIVNERATPFFVRDVLDAEKNNEKLFQVTSCSRLNYTGMNRFTAFKLLVAQDRLLEDHAVFIKQHPRHYL